MININELEKELEKELKLNNFTKFYPIGEKLNDLGFYMALTKTVRHSIDGLYQLTLFLEDKPYMHELLNLNDLLNKLNNFNYFSKNDKHYTGYCDELILNLAQIKEKPTESYNKRVEDIQLLINKYSIYLNNVNDEALYLKIKNVFDFYVNDMTQDIETVEYFLKVIFHLL